MVHYPIYDELQSVSRQFKSGNFGLWFNKLIPVSTQDDASRWKASDDHGNPDEKTEYYQRQYRNICLSDNSLLLAQLKKKHLHQMDYCHAMTSHPSSPYEKRVFKAELNSPLITGIGASHPSETALVLDHTLGIPYIPASSIKGSVRFSHALSLLFDERGEFTDRFTMIKTIGTGKDQREAEVLDEANWETLIPALFGGDRYQEGEADLSIPPGALESVRGQAIFLDAYPLSIPELHCDIMNPHYGGYYSADGSHQAPGDGDWEEPTSIQAPGDWEDPKPIKFLTVQKNTTFLFRVLLPKENAPLIEAMEKAFSNLLKAHGIGAKTAVGYGRFQVTSCEEPKPLADEFESYLESRLSEEEKQKRNIQKQLSAIEGVPKENSAEIDRLFDAWQNESNDKIKTDARIAQAFKSRVKKKKANGDVTYHYKIVAEILGIDLEAKPESGDGSPPQRESQMKGSGQKGGGDDEAVLKKLNAIIEKGVCSKKETKKVLEKYKKDYPELCSVIKKLPNK